MRNRLLPLLGLAATAAFLATPAAAWNDGTRDGWDGWFDHAPPSFAYQGPDGTYDSPSDLSRAVNGVPCGYECTARANARWGLPPPGPGYFHLHHWRYSYYPY